MAAGKALVASVSVKDRSEIMNILDLSPPKRSNDIAIIEPPQAERYSNNYLGIAFISPAGWFIQEPPKTSSDTPDLVILGTQTSTSSPAISLSIRSTSGNLDDEIFKLETRILPLIEQNVLEIVDSGATSIDGKDAFILRATGVFENQNDIVREVGFSTILFIDDDRVYTIQYTNHLTDFYNHQEDVNIFLESFEVIHSVPDSTTFSNSEDDNQTSNSDNSEGGGCLIATAAYGSEMAPQVQFLREIRDGKVMSTQSGTAFMTGFNQFYYSFSPAVADYERENPVFKEAVKVTLTPMLTSLTLLNYVDVDSEHEILGYGIGIILLNIGMYFVAPAAAIIAIKNRIKRQ